MEIASRLSIKFWISKINDYARGEGFAIDPLPQVQLLGEDTNQNGTGDILISTGGYIAGTRQILLFIDNRHIKDILRSYCHELVHHMQNIDNSDYIRRVLGKPDTLADNAMLEEIEGDAYLRGNLLFRKFTEHLKTNRVLNKNDK